MWHVSLIILFLQAEEKVGEIVETLFHNQLSDEPYGPWKCAVEFFSHIFIYAKNTWPQYKNIYFGMNYK